MKKIDVTEEQMERIIRMRERGVSWLQIQENTEVPRRVAQRAYREWERRRLADELKAVRRELAAEDFRKHRGYVIELAQETVEKIDISTLPVLEGTAEAYLSSLLTTNRWVVKEEEGVQVTGTVASRVLSDRQVKRQNEMLFKSLKEHTSGKVRWGAYEEWKSAWDDCSRAMDDLKEEIHHRLGGELETRPELMSGFVESGPEETIKTLVDTVLKTLWRSSLSGNLERLTPAPGDPGQHRDYIITSIWEGKHTFRIPWNTAVSRDILEDGLNRMVEELYAGETFRVIMDKVDSMNTAFSELEEALNQLRLAPLILATSCDLCPL